MKNDPLWIASIVLGLCALGWMGMTLNSNTTEDDIKKQERQLKRLRSFQSQQTSPAVIEDTQKIAALWRDERDLYLGFLQKQQNYLHTWVGSLSNKPQTFPDPQWRSERWTMVLPSDGWSFHDNLRTFYVGLQRSFLKSGKKLLPNYDDSNYQKISQSFDIKSLKAVHDDNPGGSRQLLAMRDARIVETVLKALTPIDFLMFEHLVHVHNAPALKQIKDHPHKKAKHPFRLINFKLRLICEFPQITPIIKALASNQALQIEVLETEITRHESDSENRLLDLSDTTNPVIFELKCAVRIYPPKLFASLDQAKEKNDPS